MSWERDFEWTVEHDGDEVDVLVEYSISSYGAPAIMPSWSHPGDPAEPPEFEIDRVTRLDNGQQLILSAEAQQKLEERCLELIDEGARDQDYEAELDWRNEW